MGSRRLASREGIEAAVRRGLSKGDNSDNCSSLVNYGKRRDRVRAEGAHIFQEILKEL
jgi:hypothetical protein